MSFSSEIKKELAEITPKDAHCAQAELYAFLLNAGAETADTRLLERTCCRKAFLRGMFLSSGSAADPNKLYQLEIICHRKETASLCLSVMEDFGIKAKTVVRKSNYVIYLKDGDRIADFLAAVEAVKALLKLEDVRVYKEVAGKINREVNRDTANLNKRVNASVRRQKEIALIEATIGLDALPPAIREAAMIRKAHPDATLNELGAYFDPPIGKSGINHRLRRLKEIADSLS